MNDVDITRKDTISVKNTFSIFEKHASSIGLKIHGEIEYMYSTKNNQVKDRIGHNIRMDVFNFKFLGTMLSDNTDIEEVNCRIHTGNKALMQITTS